MRRRAEREEETRRRIVDAAVALHRERGILDTKPVDIAARADVSLATYYKHFPSLGTLVTACSGRAREQVPLPKPETVAALPPDLTLRIPALVRALFEDYQVREPLIYAARTEEKFLPELRVAADRFRQLRDAFVEAALSESDSEPQKRGAVAALVDFWAWRTLRKEAGLSQEEAIRSVTDAVQQIVNKSNPTRRAITRRRR